MIEYAAQVTWSDEFGRTHIYLDYADSEEQARGHVEYVSEKTYSAGQALIRAEVVWREVSEWTPVGSVQRDL